MHLIYRLTSPDGKIYIGQTTNEKRRFFPKGYTHNSGLTNAIKEYGLNNFKKEILEECFTAEEANEREKYYIKLYQSTDSSKGYNISIGGAGGFNGLQHSEKSIAQIKQNNIYCGYADTAGQIKKIYLGNRKGINK